jgi:hypothetical protein
LPVTEVTPPVVAAGVTLEEGAGRASPVELLAACWVVVVTGLLGTAGLVGRGAVAASTLGALEVWGAPEVDISGDAGLPPTAGVLAAGVWLAVGVALGAAAAFPTSRKPMAVPATNAVPTLVASLEDH